MQYKLSFLIPARNEEWLGKTIQDILEHTGEETEIIAGLDGYWPDPGIPDHPRLTLVHMPESIGQRALTNALCRLSRAKYIAKIDSHCAIDRDWDKKMFDAFEKVGDNVTMVSIMRNLHVFDHVCSEGHRRYQGPDIPCKECGKLVTKEVIWNPKVSPQSKSYCFDSAPHFQYFGEHTKRSEYEKMLEETGFTETMSLQGSCFIMTREKYWELNICDETFGSWGSQAIEVACKTWLSGGRVMVNHKTWYAHCFRTQGGSFGFPYPISGNQVASAKKMVGEMFFENKWPLQKYPLSWLLDKFWPVKGWTDEERAKITKAGEEFYRKQVAPVGIIYYTDNRLNLKIAHKVQKQLKRISKDKNIPIVSCSLKPMSHFGKNIHLPLQRGLITMFKQQLAALEACNAEVVFFCEHDVIYHPSHFDFRPKGHGIFYYNVNVWKVNAENGHSLWVNNCIQVSGLCGFREDLIQHYKERVALAEGTVWDRNWGFEPGTPGKTVFKTPFIQETWTSEYPNLDIRHTGTLSKNRWTKDLFRDKRNCEGWTETVVNKINGWEELKI